MHTHDRHTVARLSALAARLVGVAVACALAGSLVLPATAGADGDVGRGMRVIREPAVQDGYRGWTTRVTTVRILPSGPGTVYYTWGAPIGGWQRYSGELVVPEGKRTLSAILVAEDGTVAQRYTSAIMVDYDGLPLQPTRDLVATAGGATGLVGVSVRINPWTGAKIIRLGGRDRYETSAMISAQTFPTADTVIIATGENFADALSSSGLAGCVEGPVLLTRRYGLKSTVTAEIARLGASRAIIAGGPKAVGSAVEQQLAELGLSVQRIGGADRYATAAMISSQVLVRGGSSSRVFIARGDDFADALALGPLAYVAKAPLLLVKPNSVPSATRSFLGANPISSGCIAGGTVAVSPDVAAELGGYVPGLERVAGNSRYSTAAAVASWAQSNGLCTTGMVGMATGTDFADALCGGVAAGANGGVILLTKPSELPPATSDAIEIWVGDMRDMQIYGGERAITPGVFDQVSLLTR